MSPDDPRHGTEAGHEQHQRDGEEACPSCYHAKLIAARRRGKRKAMGYRYTMPIGPAIIANIDHLLKRGATYEDIGRWAGVSESQVYRARNQGPNGIVYARTRHRLATMTPGRILTPTGMTRRIRALMWLGYSANVIAAESGIHGDTIKDARDGVREFVAKKVEDAIVDTYDRLHMKLPSEAERYQRASVTRTRNYARARGFLPPLAWDDIDDPDEKPTVGSNPGKYRRDELLAEWDHLSRAGYSMEQAAARLGLTADAIEAAVYRHSKEGAA